MNNPLLIKMLTVIISAALTAGLFLSAVKYFQPEPTRLNQAPIINNGPQPVKTQTLLALPLSEALKRVTKKPFGIYIAPDNSPVSPEKFTGYHTGVDFEITPDEENKDMPISAICSGALLMKKSATGYGGVAVQSCKLDNQAITIIYGHLKLSSIGFKVGQAVAAGEKIGLLGQGYSGETGGERKHLHLGLHRGSAINLLGYAQDKKLLSGWLNALDYLK